MHPAVGIALAHDLPYTGLRDFSVDARLWRYVPVGLALRERIIPLTLIGDELKIACGRPDPDLSSLTTHFPRLRVGLVIAPEEEIDAILADVDREEETA